MTRARSFCRYCGALTTYLDSCCAGHRDLLEAERDLIPPDPLAILPTMAAESVGTWLGEDTEATRERGN